MMRNNNIVNWYHSHRLAIPAHIDIDIFKDICYVISNIPVRPLPQGKLNYDGSFIWGAE